MILMTMCYHESLNFVDIFLKISNVRYNKAYSKHLVLRK